MTASSVEFEPDEYLVVDTFSAKRARAFFGVDPETPVKLLSYGEKGAAWGVWAAPYPPPENEGREL